MNKQPEQKNAPSALTVLTIEGDDYLLPANADIGGILKALAGIRKVRSEYFWHLKPPLTVVKDNGAAEFSVSAWHRELVSAEQFETLKEAERIARDAETEAAKNRAMEVAK